MRLVALVLLSVGTAIAQSPTQKNPSEEKPSPESAKAIEDFKVDAAAYDIRLASRPKEKLKLHPEPLLHWGNPARTGEDGAVFVWLLDGRPEVIGSVFTYRLPKVIRRKHEYHSLAAEPLTAKYEGQTVWAPSAAGISFRPVPDAQPPAGSARLRLTQMKSLARQFSARMVDREGQRSELRLLANPLIRYESPKRNILDGALFSFSLGTDPEVILVLEAAGEKDHAAWQYAFARYHYIDLTAFHKDQQVWHVETLPGIEGLEIGSPTYRDSAYATYHTRTTPVAE
jgi:hypothetical protein